MSEDCKNCDNKNCKGPLISAKLILGNGVGEVEVVFDEKVIPNEFVDRFLRYLAHAVDSWKGWDEINNPKIPTNKTFH